MFGWLKTGLTLMFVSNAASLFGMFFLGMFYAQCYMYVKALAPHTRIAILYMIWVNALAPHRKIGISYMIWLAVLTMYTYLRYIFQSFYMYVFTHE